MSFTYTTEVSNRPVQRVRHQVRDGLAVIAFSAIASSAFALTLMYAVRLGS